VADVQTVYLSRPGANGREAVTNDDQVNVLCRFESGVMGSCMSAAWRPDARWATPSISPAPRAHCASTPRNQNALWFYDARLRRGRQGFTKILTAPEHPDFRRLL